MVTPCTLQFDIDEEMEWAMLDAKRESNPASSWGYSDWDTVLSVAPSGLEPDEWAAMPSDVLFSK